MKAINKYGSAMLTSLLALSMIGCQKMDRPGFSNYPKDTNPPGGPLKFYAAFDGTTSDPSRNAVDSIRANFASENQGTVIDGPKGKALGLTTGKHVKYAKPNDWASSGSFSVAFWQKHNGAPATESQFPFSIASSSGHWSGSTMFILLDHMGAGSTNNLAVIKFMIADKKGEKWFELVGADRMPGILDNNWHHLAFTYSASTSNMDIYKDGQLFKTINWAGHGAIELEPTKVTALLVGGKTPSWGETWNGGLDQFRLYSTALSASEVQMLYTNKM